MRGAFKGAGVAWLGLIALQAVGTDGGSGRIRGAFAVLQGIVERALDPTVPAIPDLRAGGTWGGGPLAPGTEIDPTATGQASQDGSSGHQWDTGPAAPPPRIPVPSSPTTAQPYVG